MTAVTLNRGGAGVPVDVRGSDAQGRLLVAAELGGGLFHLPEDGTTGAAAVALRPGPGLDLPPDLPPDEAAAWVAAEVERCAADRWFAAVVERDGRSTDTLWAAVDPATDHSPAEFVAATAAYLRESLPMSGDPALLRELLDSLLPVVEPREPLAELTAVLRSGGGEPVELESGGGTIGFRMGTDELEWDCLAEVTDGWLVVFAQLPVDFDDPSAAVEILAEINRELHIGCLLADAEGTVLYRACTDASAAPAALRRLVDTVHREVSATLAALERA